jgi:hypothetical protein
MNIFRDNIKPSPIRQAFGIHSITKKVLVPIDLCVLTDTSTQPDFALQSQGDKILEASTSLLIGTVPSILFPSPANDINPVIALDNSISSSNIAVVRSTTIQVGSNVVLNLTTSTSINGIITGSVQQKPFPTDISFTIQAFKVKLNSPIGSNFIGAPLLLATTRETVGMILTAGKDILVFPASLI